MIDAKKLLDEFHVPKHVRRHSERVADVCRFIGGRIPGVDVELLVEAALLHDLVRVCDFRGWDPEKYPECNAVREKYKGRRHEEAAAEILAERGEVELADLVRSHRFANILDGLDGWEQKILYYADKRVEHDEVVGLEERLDRGKERNAVTAEEKAISDGARPKIFELEAEICEAAGIEPEDFFGEKFNH